MDQHGHSHLQPEPCIVYGNVPPYPLPIHPMIPAPANLCNFSFQPVPEHNGSALVYGVPQLNGIPPQHSAMDLAVAGPSCHYNPYLEHPSGSYGCSITYMDSISGSFKGKNPHVAPGNFQHHNVSAGPSSSAPHVAAMPPEPDITLMDSASFLAPRVIDPMPMVTSCPQRSTGNRPGMIRHEFVPTCNTNHLVPGNYVAPPVQLPRSSWSNMRFGANNGDVSTFAQTHTPPYGHARIHGAGVEAGNVNPQCYQVTASNSSRDFLPPSIPQAHGNHHHPASSIQRASAYNVNFPAQVTTPLHAGINAFQDAVDPRPTFLVPIPQMGFPFFQPQQHRGMVHGSSARHHTHPHSRVSSEDEPASLDIPGYHVARNYIDQHHDMRLDIDHMSYEELLVLGEQIGHVTTGLTMEFIQNNLKTKHFTSSAIALNLGEATCPDDQINFCVICQTGYEDEERIGTLDCGHEYHSGCITKWLVIKNSCPVCKSIALTGKVKDL